MTVVNDAITAAGRTKGASGRLCVAVAVSWIAPAIEMTAREVPILADRPIMELALEIRPHASKPAVAPARSITAVRVVCRAAESKRAAGVASQIAARIRGEAKGGAAERVGQR